MVRVDFRIAIGVCLCASASDSALASEELLPQRLRHPARHHHTAHHTERQTFHEHNIAFVTTSLPVAILNNATTVTQHSHANAQASAWIEPLPARPQAIQQATSVDVLHSPIWTSVSNDVATAVASSDADAPDNDGANATLVQLGEELAELKQRRANIAQLEQALKADKTLFRESVSLERVSTSKNGRKAATRQARRSAQLVQDTVGMLRDSRAGAVDESRFLGTESEQATSLASALSAEASLELKLFGAADGEIRDAPIPAAAAPMSTTTPMATDDVEELDAEDEN